MALLGSKKRPLWIRVPTERIASVFLDWCDRYGFSGIVSISTEDPPDLNDLQTLLDLALRDQKNLDQKNIKFHVTLHALAKAVKNIKNAVLITISK